MANNTLRLFDRKIHYDPDQKYGIFNTAGNYGILPVERTLPRIAGQGDNYLTTPFLGR